MKSWMLAAAVPVAIGVMAAALAAEDAARRPLYGATWEGSLRLARIDPDSLRPLAGRRVGLAGEPLGWSFAPDRSRLALGSAPRGAELRLIDLRRMRALGDVRVARRGSAIATAWAGPRRVIAVVVTPGCCGAGDTIVAGVDVRRRRVVWERRLGGSLQAGERLRRGVLLVLGPRGRSIGPSRLVEVRARGTTHSAALPEIRSGTESRGRVSHSWDPGLAVDRSSGRAFVVQAEAPLAEVDLATFAVRWHPLQPMARAADAAAGPTRHALWLGRGTLAVTGSDTDHSGGRERTTPAGLTLVDTRRWRARTIDSRTTDVAVAAGTVLASSFVFDSRRGTTAGSGLTGYDLDGTRRFHLFGKAAIPGVQPLGRRALVGTMSGNTLIDARTGRSLRTYRRFTASLFAGDAPFQ